MKNNIITTRIAESRSKTLRSVAKDNHIDPKKKKVQESGSFAGAAGQLLQGTISGEGVYTPKKTLLEAYNTRGPEYKDMTFSQYSEVAKKDPLYGTSGSYDTSTSEDLKPVTTKKQAGTQSDVATTIQERRYGAGGRMDSIRLRKEKKYGRRQLRQLEKYYKKMGIDENHPDYDADKIKSLKAMKMGQGPAAQQMYERMTDPDVVRVQQEQQRLKKIPGLSTRTENLQDIQKKQAGGETVMAPEGTESVDAAKKRIEGKLNFGAKSYSDQFKKIGEQVANMPAFTKGIGKNPSAYKNGKVTKPSGFKMGGYGSKSYKK